MGETLAPAKVSVTNRRRGVSSGEGCREGSRMEQFLQRGSIGMGGICLVGHSLAEASGV